MQMVVELVAAKYPAKVLNFPQLLLDIIINNSLQF